MCNVIRKTVKSRKIQIPHKKEFSKKPLNFWAQTCLCLPLPMIEQNSKMVKDSFTIPKIFVVLIFFHHSMQNMGVTVN